MHFSVWESIFQLLIFSGIKFISAQNINPQGSPDSAGKDARVYEGTPVDPPHSRPYIAQIVTVQNRKKIVMGGVIYDKWTILTFPDSYGFEKPKKIFAGKYYTEKFEDSQQERSICMYSEHPNKSSEGFHSYDYGIVHLREPLEFNEFVQPAVLPQYQADYPTSNCSIFGWGRLKQGQANDQPAELRETTIAVLEPYYCPSRHYTLICVSGKVCWYDLGAAVVCKWDSGSDVVIGYVTEAYDNCMQTVLTSIAQMPPVWFKQQLDDAAKKCRPSPPPPPPPPPPPNPPPPPPTPPPPPPPPPGESCCNDFTYRPEGKPVRPHSRPYIVQIHSRTGQISVGVLIDAKTVLASPYNVRKIDKIVAGKHFYGQKENTEQIRVDCFYSKHRLFNKPKYAYGYGMIHIADPFVFNEYVSSVSLAQRGEDTGEKCLIIGWQGTAIDNELREQAVKFKNPNQCPFSHQTVSCVDRGACLHDLGSPVVCITGSKTSLHAIAASEDGYCENAVLASVPEMPRDWLAVQLKKASILCPQHCANICKNK